MRYHLSVVLENELTFKDESVTWFEKERNRSTMILCSVLLESVKEKERGDDITGKRENDLLIFVMLADDCFR